MVDGGGCWKLEDAECSCLAECESGWMVMVDGECGMCDVRLASKSKVQGKG
jgi:hypothetical protein